MRMCKQEKGLVLDPSTEQWIYKNLENLEYGVVQIIVHQGKIVQIDRTEKIRFDKK
jgi:hypothetical protein